MSFFGIHRLLAHPRIYIFMNSILWGSPISKIFVSTYIRPKEGDKILDIGCGPAEIIEFFPPVDYCGFDMNEEYIAYARKKYSDKGKFFCKLVSSDAIPGKDIFDIVLASGVVHHLTDNEAGELFELAYTLLKPGGRIITLDGVYVPTQSWFVRRMLSNDRGKFVRTEEECLAIARKYFSTIRVSIRSDLLRLPYTHIIMEAEK